MLLSRRSGDQNVGCAEFVGIIATNTAHPANNGPRTRRTREPRALRHTLKAQFVTNPGTASAHPHQRTDHQLDLGLDLVLGQRTRRSRAAQVDHADVQRIGKPRPARSLLNLQPRVDEQTPERRKRATVTRSNTGPTRGSDAAASTPAWGSVPRAAVP